MFLKQLKNSECQITIISQTGNTYTIIKRPMPSQIPQQYLKKLQAYYDQVNTEKAQHITQEQLKQWMKLCLNDQDISQNPAVQEVTEQFQDAFELWVDGYLREVCGLDSEKIEKLEFKQEEAMQFFGWVLDSLGGQEQLQGEEQDTQQKQINEQQGETKQSPKQMQKNRSRLTQNKSSVKNNPSQLSQNTKNNTSDLNNQPTQRQHLNLFTQQQPNEFSQHLTNSQPTHHHPQINQLKNLQTSIQLPQDDQRYRQYLQTIFEHYCKISFGLTKDNTFDSMQKNVSIITMNKFMIFANDFELNILLAASLPKENNQKPNKIHIRNLLMEVFKKNSAFHKEMNFQQFLLALERLAETCFTKMKTIEEGKRQNKQANQVPKQGQSSTNSKTKYSFEMVKMIKYLEISSFKEFKQKMTKFNINFSLRFNKQLQEKKLPINYKFKFESEENLKKLSQHQNDKSAHNQNRPPVLPSQKRNIVLKQGEQNVNRPKYSVEIGKPPLQSKMSTPNMMSLAGSNNPPPRDRKIVSNKNISSHQKLGSVPNRDRNIINFNNNNQPPQQKVTRQSLEKLRTPAPTYEGVLEGYANIHLAKKGLLPVDQSKNAQIKKKGDFQLNNVIEQARKQAQDPRVHYDYLDSRSGRALSNISASKPLSHYSRDPASNQSYRQSRNQEQLDILRPVQSYSKQMKKNFTEVPVIKNNSRVTSVHNELEGLIDFNDSDEDEYLHQHLRKEKENDTEITVRVQKKISSLNFKV